MLTSPAVITAGAVAGAVLAVGAIGVTGKAIYDLKQAEAEAAANMVANTWCQANIQRCYTGVPGRWVINARASNGVISRPLA